MRNRTWRWLRIRIRGCLSADTRLSRWYEATHHPQPERIPTA